MSEIPNDVCLESVLERMLTSGSLCCTDFRADDRIDITVADGQKILMYVCDPTKGRIAVTSCGPWAIWLHMTDDWGMAFTETGGSRTEHRLCAGYRLYIGPWETPAVTRIVLNGFDLTNPAASKKN